MIHIQISKYMSFSGKRCENRMKTTCAPYENRRNPIRSPSSFQKQEIKAKSHRHQTQVKDLTHKTIKHINK